MMSRKMVVGSLLVLFGTILVVIYLDSEPRQQLDGSSYPLNALTSDFSYAICQDASSADEVLASGDGCGCIRGELQKAISYPDFRRFSELFVSTGQVDTEVLARLSDTFSSCAQSTRELVGGRVAKSEVLGQIIGRNSQGREFSMADFNVTRNPRGDGYLIWISFSESRPRHLFWIVIDGEVYPFNGWSRQLTPFAEYLYEDGGALSNRANITSLEARRLIFGD